MKSLSFILFLFLSGVCYAGSASTDGAGSGSSSTDGLGSGTIVISTVSSEVAGTTIGNTTHDDLNVRGADEFFYSTFTVTAAGQITNCHIYVSALDQFTFGIYTTDGTLLSDGNTATTGGTTGWQNVAVDSVNLSEGVEYVLGAVTNDTSWSNYKRTTHSGHIRKSINMTYATSLANADFSSPNFVATNTSFTHYCDTNSGDPN